MSQNETEKSQVEMLQQHRQMQNKFGQKVLTMMSQSFLPACYLSLVFMFGLTYFTPLMRRSPYETVAFGVSLATIAVFTHLVFKTRLLRFGFERKSLIFSGAALALCLSWGCFSAWVTYSQLISWTTFLVLLLNCAVAISVLSVVHPSLWLLRTTILVQSIPLITTCLLYLRGQQAYAFSLFFLGFGFALYRLGRIQYRAFWENLRNANKISAVVDALPGSLMWIDSEMVVQGSNQQFRDRFPVEVERECPEQVKGLAKKILAGEVPTEEVKIGRKTSLMTGKKFNGGTEAVIMGIDVSGREVFESQLEESRDKLLNNIHQFEKGKLFEALFSLSSETFTREELHEFQSVTSELSAPLILVMNWALRLSKPRGPMGVAANIQVDPMHLHIQIPEPAKVLMALFEVLVNSFESVESVEHPEVSMVLQLNDNGDAEISVSDNGVGVEEGFEDLVFEPFISEKTDHLGMGLSLAKEHLLGIGDIQLGAKESRGTTMIVSIPKAHLVEEAA